MPDLHGWINQQIDDAERLARTGIGNIDINLAVLRRCAADRKILEVHKPYGGRGYGGHACTGCGELNEDWAVEHANDCPTLLALAGGYGLTPEILATLDRPIPEPYPPVRLSGPRPDTRRVPAALRGPNWKARP